jgi:hypothetical protein
MQKGSREMRTRTTLLVTLVAALLATPLLAAAQVVVSGEAGRRGWIGISFNSGTLRTNAETKPIVRITHVADESPAQAAGLLVGDTIMSVNDIAASEPLMSSLGFSLSPGESVRLRIRRDGRERDVTLVAAERPAQLARTATGRVVTIHADSILDRARVYFDSAAAQMRVLRTRLDSLRLPSIIIEGRNVEMISPDSVRWLRTDSLHPIFMSRFRIDTIAPGQIRIRGVGGDTLLRAEMDSVVQRLTTAIAARPPGPRGVVEIEPWGAMTPGARGFEGGVTFFAQHTIAGAQLADVDPAMESYFGTTEGVLVLRVGVRTPAANAGLRPGDVIIGINDSAVTNATELRQRMADVPRGEPIRLEVLRERRAMRLEIGRD